MLDLATLFFVAALVDTAGTLIFVILWSRNRGVPGLALLALGMGVLALGIWLQMLRPLLPSTLGIIAANTGINLGHAIMLIAVSRMVGRPGPVLTATLGFLGVTAAFIYYAVVEPSNVVARIIIVSLMIGTCLFGSGWQFFRAAPSASRVIHLALGGTVTVGGLFMYARAALTWAQGHVAYMLTSHPIHLGILIISIVIGFVYILGFVLLISHRLQAQVDRLDSLDGMLNPIPPER